MMKREVAWRVFAAEFNDSTIKLESKEEMSPSYLISPLGARMNRVFTVGVIIDIENLGTPAEPMWRARMTDPTGTFYISAGQYQPEAALSLSKIRPPAFVAIIGKVRTYSPEDGVLYVSISPEVVRQVDEDVRDYWVLESCRALKERLEAHAEASKMSPPSAEELMKLGYSEQLSKGLEIALEEYPAAPTDRYRDLLEESLNYLLPENKEGKEELVPVAYDEDDEPDIPDYDDMEEEAIEVMAGDIDEPEEEKPGPSDDDKDGDEEADEELTADEVKMLELTEELDKDGSGVDWEDLEAGAKKAKLKKPAFEEAIMGLLDKCLVYEPILGKIKKV
ncbi:MAG: hypothetical protein KAS67_05195 [Thermoplasmata archaeon]|nr:hypothetical protein [Thermoplasmata archaeon]